MGASQNWDITIVPDGSGDITLRLAVSGSCGDKTAICTPDGEQLTITGGEQLTVDGELLTAILTAIVSRQ